MYQNSITIIIPAYNEEHGIAGVLSHLTNVMNASGITYEIIVVDDGSKDKTAENAARHNGITVLRHRINKGYGASIKTGIRHATYDLICITDADGTYPNDRIPHLLSVMREKHADMVVGARTGKEAKIPFIRKPAKWAIAQLARFVTGDKIPDLNSGLRIFKKDAALRFFGILPDGFSFTTTITMGMMTNGFIVEYVPIEYAHRIGRSKIKPVRDTLNFVQLVFRIGLYFAPLKIFLPISGFVVLCAVGWGFFSLFVLGELSDVSTIVIAMTGLQIAVMGMLGELINRRIPNVYREEDT